MIDAACFPGSSGSPVFIYNSGSFAGSGGGLHLGARLMLIGVLFAGHLHTSVGEIKVVPTATAPVPVSRIPNNLGICVHASRILDFIPVLKKKIDDGEAKKAAAMP